MMKIVRFGDKEAVRFTTKEGVRALVASSVNPDLMQDL